MDKIKELLRKLYGTAGVEVSDARIDELVAQSPDPYSLLEEVGAETGLIQAMGDKWQPETFLKGYGIDTESIQESEAPADDVTTPFTANAPTPVQPNETVQKYASLGYDKFGDIIQEAERDVKNIGGRAEDGVVISNIGTAGELRGMTSTVRARPSKEQKIADAQELLTQEIPFQSYDDLFNHYRSETGDAVAAVHAARNYTSLVQSTRGKKIQALSEKLSQDFNINEILDVEGPQGNPMDFLFAVSTFIKEGQWDVLPENVKSLYLQMAETDEAKQAYKESQLYQRQLKDHWDSIGEFDKTIRDQRLKKQKELELQKDIRKFVPSGSQNVPDVVYFGVRSGYLALDNFIESFKDVTGQSQISGREDLSDDLKRAYDSAEDQEGRNAVLKQAALSKIADKERREANKQMPSELEGEPFERQIEKDGRLYVVDLEDPSAITMVRDAKTGRVIVPTMFSPEAEFIQQYEEDHLAFKDDVKLDFSPYRLGAGGLRTGVEMSPMLIGAFVSGGATTLLGGSSKAITAASMFGAGAGSFGHTYHDFYWDGLDQFGDDDTAKRYAYTQSTLTAVIESVIGRYESNFTRAVTGAQKQALNAARGAAARRAVEGGSTGEIINTFFNNLKGEVTEELMDVGKDEMVDAAYQNRVPEEMNPITAANTIALTGVATSLISGPTSIQQVKSESLTEWRMAMESPDLFAFSIDNAVEAAINKGVDEKAVRAKGDRLKQAITRAGKEMQEIRQEFPDLSQEQLEQADITLADRALKESKLAGLTNEQAREKLTKQIEKDNTDLDKILNQKKTRDEVQDQNQDEDQEENVQSEEEAGVQESREQEPEQAVESEPVVPEQGQAFEYEKTDGSTSTYTYDSDKGWTINGRKANPTVQSRIEEQFRASTATKTAPVTPSEGDVLERTNTKGQTVEYTYNPEKEAWETNGRRANSTIQEELNQRFRTENTPQPVEGISEGATEGVTPEADVPVDGAVDGVTDTEWRSFVDNNEASDATIDRIADKIVAGETLSERELTIQASKGEQIETKLKEKQTGETPTETGPPAPNPNEVRADALEGVEYTTKSGVTKRVVGYTEDGKARVQTIKSDGSLGSETTVDATTLTQRLQDPENTSYNYQRTDESFRQEDPDLDMDGDQVIATDQVINEVAGKEKVSTREKASEVLSAVLGRTRKRQSITPQQETTDRNTKARGRKLTTATALVNATNKASAKGKVVLRAVRRVFPTLKRLGQGIVAHENAESLANALIEQGMPEQEALDMAYNSDGIYDFDTKTAHIRLDAQRPWSALHEAFHPMFAELAKQAPRSLENLISNLLVDGELHQKYFTDFARKYGTSFTRMQEEAVVEFFAQSTWEAMANDIVGQRDPNLIQKLKEYIQAFLQDLGFTRPQSTLISTNLKTPEQVKSFIDALTQGIAQGQEVSFESESDVQAQLPTDQNRFKRSVKEDEAEANKQARLKADLKQGLAVIFTNPKTSDIPIAWIYEDKEIADAIEQGIITRREIADVKRTSARRISQAFTATKAMARNVERIAMEQLGGRTFAEINSAWDRAMLANPNISAKTKAYIEGIQDTAPVLSDQDAPNMAQAVVDDAVRRSIEQFPNKTNEQAAYLRREADAIIQSIMLGVQQRTQDMMTGWQQMALSRLEMELNRMGHGELGKEVAELGRNLLRISGRFLQKTNVAIELVNSAYWDDVRKRRDERLAASAPVFDADGDVQMSSVERILARFAMSMRPEAKEVYDIISASLENMKDEEVDSTGQVNEDLDGETGARIDPKLAMARQYWKEAMEAVRGSRNTLNAGGPIMSIAEAFGKAFYAGMYYLGYTANKARAELNKILRREGVTNVTAEQLFKDKDFMAELDRVFAGEGLLLMEAALEDGSNKPTGILARSIVKAIADTRYEGNLKEAEKYFRSKLSRGLKGKLPGSDPWLSEVSMGLREATATINATKHSQGKKVNAIAKVEDLATAIFGISIPNAQIRKGIREGRIDVKRVIASTIAEALGYSLKDGNLESDAAFASEMDLVRAFEEASDNPEKTLQQAGLRSAVGKNDIVNEIIARTGLSERAAQNLREKLNRAFDTVLAPKLEKRYEQELKRLGYADASAMGALIGKAKEKLQRLKNEGGTVDEIAKANKELKALEEKADSKFIDRVRSKIAKGSLPSAYDILQVFRIHGLDKEAFESAFGDVFDFARFNAEQISELRQEIEAYRTSRFKIDRARHYARISEIVEQGDKPNALVEFVNTILEIPYHAMLGAWSTLLNISGAQAIYTIGRMAAGGTVRILQDQVIRGFGFKDKSRVDTNAILQGWARVMDPRHLYLSARESGKIFLGMGASRFSEEVVFRPDQGIVSKIANKWTKAIYKAFKVDDIDTNTAAGRAFKEVMVGAAMWPWVLAAISSRGLLFLDQFTKTASLPYFEQIALNEELRKGGGQRLDAVSEQIKSAIDEEIGLLQAVEGISEAKANKLRRRRLRELQAERLTDDQHLAITRKLNELSYLGPAQGLPGLVANFITGTYKGAARSAGELMKSDSALDRVGGAALALTGGLGLAMLAPFANPVAHGVNNAYNIAIWPLVHTMTTSATLIGKMFGSKVDVGKSLAVDRKLYFGTSRSPAFLSEVRKANKGDTPWLGLEKGNEVVEKSDLDAEDVFSRYAMAMVAGYVGYYMFSQMFKLEDIDDEEDIDCIEAGGVDCKKKRTIVKYREDSDWYITSPQATASWTKQKGIIKGWMPNTVYYKVRDENGEVIRYDAIANFRDIPGLSNVSGLLGTWADKSFAGGPEMAITWKKEKYNKETGKMEKMLSWDGDSVLKTALWKLMLPYETVPFIEEAFSPVTGTIEALKRREEAMLVDVDPDAATSPPQFNPMSTLTNDFATLYLPGGNLFNYWGGVVNAQSLDQIPKPGKDRGRFIHTLEKNVLTRAITMRLLDQAQGEYMSGQDMDVTGNVVHYTMYDYASRFPVVDRFFNDAFNYMRGKDAKVYRKFTGQEVNLSDLPIEQQILYKNPHLRLSHYFGSSSHADTNSGRTFVEAWPKEVHTKMYHGNAKMTGALIRNMKDILQMPMIQDDYEAMTKMSNWIERTTREQTRTYVAYEFLKQHVPAKELPAIGAFMSEIKWPSERANRPPNLQELQGVAKMKAVQEVFGEEASDLGITIPNGYTLSWKKLRDYMAANIAIDRDGTVSMYRPNRNKR